MESPEWNKNIDSLRVLNEIKQKIKKLKKKWNESAKCHKRQPKERKGRPLYHRIPKWEPRKETIFWCAQKVPCIITLNMSRM